MKMVNELAADDFLKILYTLKRSTSSNTFTEEQIANEIIKKLSDYPSIKSFKDPSTTQLILNGLQQLIRRILSQTSANSSELSFCKVEENNNYFSYTLNFDEKLTENYFKEYFPKNLELYGFYLLAKTSTQNSEENEINPITEFPKKLKTNFDHIKKLITLESVLIALYQLWIDHPNDNFNAADIINKILSLSKKEEIQSARQRVNWIMWGKSRKSNPDSASILNLVFIETLKEGKYRHAFYPVFGDHVKKFLLSLNSDLIIYWYDEAIKKNSQLKNTSLQNVSSETSNGTTQTTENLLLKPSQHSKLVLSPSSDEEADLDAINSTSVLTNKSGLIDGLSSSVISNDVTPSSSDREWSLLSKNLTPLKRRRTEENEINPITKVSRKNRVYYPHIVGKITFEAVLIALYQLSIDHPNDKFNVIEIAEKIFNTTLSDSKERKSACDAVKWILTGHGANPNSLSAQAFKLISIEMKSKGKYKTVYFPTFGDEAQKYLQALNANNVISWYKEAFNKYTQVKNRSSQTEKFISNNEVTPPSTKVNYLSDRAANQSIPLSEMITRSSSSIFSRRSDFSANFVPENKETHSNEDQVTELALSDISHR